MFLYSAPWSPSPSRAARAPPLPQQEVGGEDRAAPAPVLSHRMMGERWRGEAVTERGTVTQNKGRRRSAAVPPCQSPPGAPAPRAERSKPQTPHDESFRKPPTQNNGSRRGSRRFPRAHAGGSPARSRGGRAKGGCFSAQTALCRASSPRAFHRASRRA